MNFYIGCLMSMIAANRGISENNLIELRENEYSSWLQKHVRIFFIKINCDKP